MGDLLRGAAAEGWKAFMEVADRFNHSGVEWLRDHNLCYLGLDMGWGDNCVFLGQQTYIDAKLIPVSEDRFAAHAVVSLSEAKRKTMCKQCIGLLLWCIQTRPDVNHRICELASIASDAVKNDVDFIRWVRNRTSW